MFSEGKADQVNQYQAQKNGRIVHFMNCNSFFIASIFVKNICRFAQLKISGLDQTALPDK